MGDDFRVGFGLKLVSFGEKLLFQVDVVLDDSVVDHDDLAGAIAVRMSVFLRRAAVRGPARVADAVDAVDWRDADGFLEVAQLSGGAANFKFAIVAHDGDAGRIISAIFQAPQAVQDQRHHALWADITDNAAHGRCSSKLPESR